VIQRALAVSMIRGVNLSLTGPGTSALKSCLPPTPRKGRMATARMMMPMPPNHWVSARHKRMPCGRGSMFRMTVAPVVVKPDMVSKNASAKEGRIPWSM